MLGKHLLCKKEVTGEKQKCVQDIKLRGWGDMDIRHEIELDIRIAGATVQGHIYFEKGGGGCHLWPVQPPSPKAC